MEYRRLGKAGLKLAYLDGAVLFRRTGAPRPWLGAVFPAASVLKLLSVFAPSVCPSRATVDISSM